jgi:hypothetical protein
MLGAAITLLIGIGFFIFAGSFNKSDLYIPAGVLSSSGGILLYQAYSGNWISWVYLWPLVFAGLGMGFLLFQTNNKYPKVIWLGKFWCGLSLIFTAICYSLHLTNPVLFHWPMIITGIGLMFLIPGSWPHIRAFRIPGFILTGLGIIFTYQWITYDWVSWTYIWALLPVFTGLGIVFANPHNRKAALAGNIVLGIGFMLFLIFATVFSDHWQIVRYWPLILIILGGWQLLNHFHPWDALSQHTANKKTEALE